MKILILGANGFIGSHLCDAILSETDWTITAVDLVANYIPSHPRLHFFRGDILKEITPMNEWIAEADVVIPLAAIATPADFVKNPLRVFEIIFEANLSIVRHCVLLKKRLIFPSTSEIYGMCTDSEFDEATSHWVTGPLHKERWIYSSSKQLLDRIIYAYGKHHHLSYTLFRPFNWYGPRLDHLSNAARSSRVITQFIGNILRGEDILLVNGGQQQRSFTYIEDGIHALLKIIENKNDCAAQTVFNIGNPFATISIRSLAELIVRIMKELKFPLSKTSTLRDITEEEYYGLGYQDVSLRVPKIERAKRQLNWQPKIDLMTGLTRTIHMIIND